MCVGGKAMKAKERKEGGGRDWGRGQATEGRSKECTIVSKVSLRLKSEIKT